MPNHSNKENDLAGFQPAKNNQGFLKIGIQGFPKTGKTYTAALIVAGIHARSKHKKPVFFLDTETGSDSLAEHFKEWNVPLHVWKTRSLVDLLKGVEVAEQNGSSLIIDSITHFWDGVIAAFKKANNRTRLRVWDYAPIKEEWKQFTDCYLNSKVHIVMCGRAGYVYDQVEDDDGVKQTEKIGTKMKVEADLGYEPSLLLEMVREPIPRDDKRPEGRLWNHMCYVLGDRTTVLDGKVFKNPTFADFEPVFNRLNPDGEHIGVQAGTDFTELFVKGSDRSAFEQKRQREILLQELEGELTSAYPGRGAEEVKAKIDLLQKHFNTRSWKALEDFTADHIAKSLAALRADLKSKKETPK